MRLYSSFKTISVLVAFFIGGFFFGKFNIPAIFGDLFEIKDRKSNFFSFINNDSEFVNFKTSEKIDIKKLLDKDLNLIIFWSPNCEHCKELLRNINIDTAVVRVVWIPETDDIEYLTYYLTEQKINTLQLVEFVNGQYSRINDFNVQRVPELWLIDKKGNFLFRQLGSTLEPELMKILSLKSIDSGYCEDLEFNEYKKYNTSESAENRKTE